VTEYTLAMKAGAGAMWGHDPSAALFADGEPVFAIEEERLIREKHAADHAPVRAVEACLDHTNVDVAHLDRVVATVDPSLTRRRLRAMFDHELAGNRSLRGRCYGLTKRLASMAEVHLTQQKRVRRIVRRAGDGVEPPTLLNRGHHRCHAASAFHPTEFEEAVVVTADGRGEYDATVVWHGTPGGLERVRTHEYPNSLGSFYAVVTNFLGFRPNNGEGKVMGLAPYGGPNEAIESGLRSFIDTGLDHDTTDLTTGPDGAGVARLEERFGRSRHDPDEPFDEWERDFAYVAQSLLEETLVELVEGYCRRLGLDTVGLAGGVALNCKANKRIRESELVDSLFVQPVAHDAGLVLGAGYLDADPGDVAPWTGDSVYLGPEYDTDEVVAMVEANKLAYHRPDDLERTVAKALADGQLVGWFQGRTEMGPRALGNRSILADPRSVTSRDAVNEWVKHRESWRPFAPSILAEAADDYLVDATDAPYMIQAFDIRDGHADSLAAVRHEGDDTTRPQTVTAEANPRYHRLIAEFADITGVPAVLNTSFNDHGEPIVNAPIEAVTGFYRMGLDLLAIEDVLLRKPVARDV
jgi:carbamoyltransferase